MNTLLVFPQDLNKASMLVEEGGPNICNAIATLLESNGRLLEQEEVRSNLSIIRMYLTFHILSLYLCDKTFRRPIL